MKQGQVVEVSKVGSFEGIHLGRQTFFAQKAQKTWLVTNISPLFAMQVADFHQFCFTFFRVPQLVLHDPIEDLANPTMNSADRGAVAILSRCRRLEDCRLINTTWINMARVIW